MTRKRIVIPATEVREGEPRHWYSDRGLAERARHRPCALHTVPIDRIRHTSDVGMEHWFAVVDREVQPAPANTLEEG